MGFYDFHELDWHNDQIVFPEHNTFKVYNFDTDTIITYDVPEDFYFDTSNNIKFSNDEEVLLCFTKYIFKTNLNTNENTTIKFFGLNNWWYNLDVSIDQKTILLQKKDHIKYDKCTIQLRSYLALMDMDGSNERRILIPE